MGIIKEGRVSGFVPGREAFAVHYPGYPSSISRAVETLGGLEGIHKARSLQSNRLELHFRPEDPYSHPVFGDLRPCNNLLLKISKNKSVSGKNAQVSDNVGLQGGNNFADKKHGSESDSSTKDVDVQVPEDDQTNLCADIVARVLEAYHFDGMVDYQHVVAVHADVARSKKRNWLEMEKTHSEKNGLLDVDVDDVMMLVPPLFAPKDVPENLVLRPSVILSSKKVEEAVAQPNSEIDMEPVLAIDFNINEIPKRINWEEYIPKGSNQWESQMAVSKLFDERPIWQKDSLNERLRDKGYNVVGHMLRRLLSRVAYYFSSGPFLRFWIKRGYDPRKDPDSRIYQRIDFRVHPLLRSYCDANAANQVSKREKPKWEEICAFQVFPVKCHTTLQLFELVDDYIQQEIRKPPSQKTCTYLTGWFSHVLHDNLKHRVTIRFLSTYPKPGAEHLLKEAAENFEKSKRRLSKDYVMLHEEEHHEVGPEVIGNEDVQDRNNDEDEADEEENDEEVDDELYLQSHAYLNMESISRTHLQELFGSFPSTEARGNKIEDADTSDEEYQIYEQDSDCNFSDEDDY